MELKIWALADSHFRFRQIRAEFLLDTFLAQEDNARLGETLWVVKYLTCLKQKR